MHASIRVNVAVAFIAAVVTGCASVPRVEMDKAASRSIKRIAVIEVVPPALHVVNEGGAAGGFGLIGAAIQGGMNAENTKKFSALAVQKRFAQGKDMADALASELRGRGFEPTYLAGQRARLGEDGKSADYTPISTDAQAVLHVWHTLSGYASPPTSSDYQPRMVVRARLLEWPSKRELYSKTYATGLYGNIEGVVPVASDPAARYPSFDALYGGADGAMAALLKVQREIAAQIARDLRAE